MLSDRIITNNPFVARAEMYSVAQSSTTSVHHCVFSPKVPGSRSQQIEMDKDTLNLMLSSLEGSPEESISDTISLADGFERLDDVCEGNCRQQLQLVLQRANSMIKFKDSQCKDKDDLIKLKDSQCSVMKDDLIKLKDSQCKDKDDLILYLKKCIELQNTTIDSLKIKLKWIENKIETNQTETKNQNLESLEDHIKKLNLDLKQHEDKFADYETNLKENVSKLQDDFKELKESFKQQICALEKKINEKDNQFHKLQADLLSEGNKIKELNVINENLKKQIFELEKTINETKEKLSKWESKAKANEAKHETDQLIFGSTWFDPEKNSGVAHIKIPGAMCFTAPLENSIKEAGPGWLVMQRRLNGKEQFIYRELEDFNNSFGDFEGDFWLGLDIVHQLTTYQRCELFIHLVDFKNQSKFARYNNFIIGNRHEHYKLKSLGDYSGNAGDEMRKHENGLFQSDGYGCFFWKGSPECCNLNGYYFDTEDYDPSRIWWGWEITPKSVQMLIKPQSNNL